MREWRVCPHCEDAGPKPGLIETDNNGPIVACPLCDGRGFLPILKLPEKNKNQTSMPTSR